MGDDTSLVKKLQQKLNETNNLLGEMYENDLEVNLKIENVRPTKKKNFLQKFLTTEVNKNLLENEKNPKLLKHDDYWG
jgi:hypothetical protein